MVFESSFRNKPAMTNLQPIPNDAVLVAIDVAKARNEVLIEAANHRRRRRLTLLNNRTEHDRFVAMLAGYSRPVICAFEATGNYHRPLAWLKVEAGFEARLVSSMVLARTREALHNGWDKNGVGKPCSTHVLVELEYDSGSLQMILNLRADRPSFRAFDDQDFARSLSHLPPS